MDPLTVVAEPHRRQILSLVWDEELAAGRIASHFEVTFGAVSQHLGVLRDAGFVRVRHVGTQRLYRADKEALGPLRGVLESMWSDQLDRLAAAIEADDVDGQVPPALGTSKRDTPKRKGKK
jgi:DNA-binding transcriptional ArsR family regulator